MTPGPTISATVGRVKRLSGVGPGRPATGEPSSLVSRPFVSRRGVPSGAVEVASRLWTVLGGPGSLPGQPLHRYRGGEVGRKLLRGEREKEGEGERSGLELHGVTSVGPEQSISNSKRPLFPFVDFQRLVVLRASQPRRTLLTAPQLGSHG